MAAAIAMMGALLATSASQAASVTFNFSSGGTNSSTTFGNVRTFTADGITVQARGFAIDGSGTLHQGYLGRWSQGLGVINSRNDNSHTVDNRGWTDFVEFKFSSSVIAESVRLGYIGKDADISYAFGSHTNAKFDAEYTGDPVLPFDPTQSSGSLYVFAQLGETNDSFKIKKLTVQPVPIPAALPLFGSALFGLGFIARRRRNPVS
jgi:hypothetical protein